VYELSLDPVAEDPIKTVPQEALRPLAELFTLLETAPWSGEPFNPANPGGNTRTGSSGGCMADGSTGGRAGHRTV
jgi:hypothetical protein